MPIAALNLINISSIISYEMILNSYLTCISNANYAIEHIVFSIHNLLVIIFSPLCSLFYYPAIQVNITSASLFMSIVEIFYPIHIHVKEIVLIDVFKCLSLILGIFTIKMNNIVPNYLN